MKTILITGAAGFIGRHMVQRVLETTDWNIVALDGLSYAADTFRLVQNDFFDKSRVKLLWHDLRAPIPDALAEQIGEVDYIAAVASISHVDRSIADPANFFIDNCKIGVHLLEFARVCKPEAFIQVSTDEVYGPAEVGHNHKEWEEHIPSNPYAASKSAQESAAISYWRTFGLPLIIINTMNNFGQGQHPEKFIPLIVRKLIRGEPIDVHGRFDLDKFVSGSRYWLHASSHADALIFLLKRGSVQSYPEHNRPSRWNVVGEVEVGNKNMVHTIASILGVSSNIRQCDFHSSRPGHDLRYALDGAKLQDAGWQAETGFLEALRTTVMAEAALLRAEEKHNGG